MASRPVAAVALALLLAACGDDGGSGPDEDALTEGFTEAAIAAYEAADSDREQDFARGLRLDDGCLALDQDHGQAIAEAARLAGEGEVTLDAGFLQGAPGETEFTTCGIARDDDRVSVSFGPTLRDLELTEAAIRRGPMPDANVLDVDVPDLPDDEVLLLEEDEALLQAIWVGDGFTVSVHMRYDSDRDPERAAELLAAAVDQVADALG